MFSEQEKQIIAAGTQSGKNSQEIKNAIKMFRAGVQPNPTPTDSRSSLGLAFGGVKDVAIGAAKELGTQAKDLGGAAISGATNLALGPAGAIPGVKQAVSGFVDPLKESIQGAVGLTDTNLTPANPTQDIGGKATMAAGFVSPFVGARLAGLVARGAPAVAPKVPGMVGSVINKVKEFAQNPKLVLGQQNVNPQLETSAGRMFLEGTSDRLKDPIAKYDEYLSQSKKASTDIYADPAISQVGDNIGQEFKFVVDRRKHAGKVMGDELKKVGTLKTNIAATLDNFDASIKEAGITSKAAKEGTDISYGPTNVSLEASPTAKFVQEDITLLENYANELYKLGANPTIAEVDAMIGRTSSFVNNFKSAKNLTDTSNAERLIKQNQRALRDEFTKDPKLANYAKARALYSDLSDFIDEGAGFLGKVTQSGDFAMDASLAKSAVQSVLNKGKKDWLVKLEELSGYSALDDSVLALQAMKDAGDFRGLSLLEKLSEGAPPLSKAGITQKMLDFAVDKVGKMVGGTPEEQTRAFLNALREAAQNKALQ
jgi:hypothetical protein